MTRALSCYSEAKSCYHATLRSSLMLGVEAGVVCILLVLCFCSLENEGGRFSMVPPGSAYKNIICLVPKIIFPVPKILFSVSKIIFSVPKKLCCSDRGP